MILHRHCLSSCVSMLWQIRPRSSLPTLPRMQMWKRTVEKIQANATNTNKCKYKYKCNQYKPIQTNTNNANKSGLGQLFPHSKGAHHRDQTSYLWIIYVQTFLRDISFHLFVNADNLDFLWTLDLCWPFETNCWQFEQCQGSQVTGSIVDQTGFCYGDLRSLTSILWPRRKWENWQKYCSLLFREITNWKHFHQQICFYMRLQHATADDAMRCNVKWVT